MAESVGQWLMNRGRPVWVEQREVADRLSRGWKEWKGKGAPIENYYPFYDVEGEIHDDRLPPIPSSNDVDILGVIEV